MYYVEVTTPNSWDVHVQVDCNDVGGGAVTYSDSGSLLTPANGALTLSGYTPTNGAAPMNLALDLSGSTQYGDTFSLNSLKQDGYATGSLTTVEITAGGVVQARYTNGQATPLGQIALRSEEHTSELQSLMRTSYAVFCLKKKNKLKYKTTVL